MGPPPDDWRLVEADGTVTVFDGSNFLIKSQTTPGGQTTEFSYTTGSTIRVAEMKRSFAYGSSQLTIEYRKFEYDGNDRLQYVTLQRATTTNGTPTDIRRLELVYYTTNEDTKGNVGDLKLVKQQLLAPGPTWVDNKIHLFRYYTESEEDGFQHALKYVLSPQGYDEITDPEGWDNSELAPFASVYYEYDSERRVSKVAVEGGAVEETIVYAINENTTDPPPDFTYDQWFRKAVITQPNVLKKTIYSNHIAQDLLIDDDKDGTGTNNWITFSKYNSDYRLIELVHPSAIDMNGTPYNDGENDLDVAIYTNQGRIDIFTYVTGSTAKGYLEFRKIQKGSTTGTDNPVNLSKLEYGSKLPLVQMSTVTCCEFRQPMTSVYGLRR